MGRFIVSRLVQALLSLVAVTVIVFGATQLTGDPALVLMPEDYSQEMYEAARQRLGTDRPLVVQYGSFLGDLSKGDLGTSTQNRRPVAELIAGRLAATIELGGAALLLTVIVGFPLGLYSGYWSGSLLDRSARFIAVLGQAAPPFWVAMLLILLFAIRLDVLPTGGRGGIRHLILPAGVMAWAALAGVIRLMRSSVQETLEADYIRMCRIKGMSETRLLWKHTARNAGLPVLTFGGVLAGSLITGSVVTEVVFVWPGMSRLIVDGITTRDFPVVQGGILVLTLVYVSLSFLVDVLYTYMNPQVRVAA